MLEENDIKKGDRVKLVHPINELHKIGEIFKIENIGKYLITIISEETNQEIFISDIGINIYFKKVEEPKHDKSLQSVSSEKIKEIMAKSEIVVQTLFNKTTVVAAKFPNGFVITESSSCVDHRNYDEELGKQICLKRIEERLWEMEGYFLQEQEYSVKKAVNSTDNINLSKPKNKVTTEIAKMAYEDLKYHCLKEYKKNNYCYFDQLEKIYDERLEKVSKNLNLDKGELEEEINKIPIQLKEKILKTLSI